MNRAIIKHISILILLFFSVSSFLTAQEPEKKHASLAILMIGLKAKLLGICFIYTILGVFTE